METNEQKAKEIARLKRITKNEKYEHPFQLEIYERCLEMAEWKDEQLKEQRRIIRNHWQEWAEELIKNQEQTLLWTVEHILDRLCIEGEAREIAIKEFTNDLQYYNETEDDSKE